MAHPDLPRKVRQHTADIYELYELVGVVDRKVDDLADETRDRFDAVDQRFDAMDRRLDAMEGQLTSMGGQLTEILQRLP